MVNLWYHRHQTVTDSKALITRMPGGHGHIVYSTSHTWKKNLLSSNDITLFLDTIHPEKKDS